MTPELDIPKDHEYADGTCVKCGELQNPSYICGPGELEYLVAIHRTGARAWDPVGDWVGTVAEAFSVLATTVTEKRRSGWYNRAGIWGAEKGFSYYEPKQLYEVTW